MGVNEMFPSDIVDRTVGPDAGLTPAQLDDFERIQSGFGSLGNVENVSSGDFTIPRTDLGNGFGTGEGLVIENGRRWPMAVGGLGLAVAYSFGSGGEGKVYAKTCELVTSPEGNITSVCHSDPTDPTTPKPRPTPTTLPNQIINVDGDMFSLTFNPNTNQMTVDNIFGIDEVNDTSKGYGEAGYNLLVEMMRIRGVDLSTMPAEQQAYIMDVGYTVTPAYFNKFLPDLFAIPVIKIPEVSEPETTSVVSTSNQQTGSSINGSVTPTTQAKPTPESNNSSRVLIGGGGVAFVVLAAGATWTLRRKRTPEL